MDNITKELIIYLVLFPIVCFVLYIKVIIQERKEQKQKEITISKK